MLQPRNLAGYLGSAHGYLMGNKGQPYMPAVASLSTFGQDAAAEEPCKAPRQRAWLVETWESSLGEYCPQSLPSMLITGHRIRLEHHMPFGSCSKATRLGGALSIPLTLCPAC